MDVVRLDKEKMEEITKELMKATLSYVKAVGWPSGCSTCTQNLKYDPQSSLDPCEYVPTNKFIDGPTPEAHSVDYKTEDKKIYIRQTMREWWKVTSHQYVCFQPNEIEYLCQKFGEIFEQIGDKHQLRSMKETCLNIILGIEKAIKKTELEEEDSD